MVYGLDYCASEECYNEIKARIKRGVVMTPGVEFTDTRELGRVNKIDPLGITYLRVRGMWGIENPWSVFDYVYQRDVNKQFTFMCIINNKKWGSFNNTNNLFDLTHQEKRLQIKEVRIKNPDNPAQLVDAKLISFSF